MIMKYGICIELLDLPLDADRSNPTSVFGLLFLDAFRILKDYWWVNPPFGSCFLSGYVREEEFSVYWDLEESFPTVMKPGEWFPERLSWVSDDNTDLWGFENEPSEEMVEALHSYDIADRVVLDRCSVYFCSLDGAYWWCFSRDSKILELCFESAKSARFPQIGRIGWISESDPSVFDDPSELKGEDDGSCLMRIPRDWR